MFNPPPPQPRQTDGSGYAVSLNNFVSTRSASVPAQRWSAVAIVSVIAGLMGCIPWLTGLIAITSGILAIRATRDPLVQGRRIAMVGIALGLLSFLFWTVSAVLWIVPYRNSPRSGWCMDQFISNLAAGKMDYARFESNNNITQQQLESDAALLKSWGTLNNLTVQSSLTSLSIPEKGTARGIMTFVLPQQKPNVHEVWIHCVDENDVMKVDRYWIK